MKNLIKLVLACIFISFISCKEKPGHNPNSGIEPQTIYIYGLGEDGEITIFKHGWNDSICKKNADLLFNEILKNYQEKEFNHNPPSDSIIKVDIDGDSDLDIIEIGISHNLQD